MCYYDTIQLYVMISHLWIHTKHAVYYFYFKQSQVQNSPRNKHYPRSDRSIGSARKKTRASTNVLKKACLKNRPKFQELRLPSLRSILAVTLTNGTRYECFQTKLHQPIVPLISSAMLTYR